MLLGTSHRWLCRRSCRHHRGWQWCPCAAAPPGPRWSDCWSNRSGGHSKEPVTNGMVTRCNTSASTCIRRSSHFDVRYVNHISWGFPGGSEGKESGCNSGDLGSVPGWEDPLEKELATHSSGPAWRLPWTEEPGGLQFMGSHRVGHDWATNTFDAKMCTRSNRGFFNRCIYWLCIIKHFVLGVP